jgi:hypothetical protein
MRVAKGCPICVSDVLGTLETGFYCKHCNLIFSRRHISFRQSRDEVRGLIHRHFSGYEKTRAETKQREAKRRTEPLDEVSRAIRTHVEGVKRIHPAMSKVAKVLEEVEEQIEWPMMGVKEMWEPAMRETPTKKIPARSVASARQLENTVRREEKTRAGTKKTATGRTIKRK